MNWKDAKLSKMKTNVVMDIMQQFKYYEYSEARIIHKLWMLNCWSVTTTLKSQYCKTMETMNIWVFVNLVTKNTNIGNGKPIYNIHHNITG